MFEQINQFFSIENTVSLLPNILSATLSVLFFVVLYFIVAHALQKALKKTKLVEALRRILVRSIFKWVIIIFALISVLKQFGIDVTAALAGVGIIGIALGFAAKESLANVLSGFSIFMDNLYKVGDWVEISDKYGQVKQITLRTTKIRTLDNIFIIVPNSDITENPVTNFSEDGMVRITAKISIGYSESVEKAREVIVAAAKEIEGVRQNPEPAVVVDSLGDSSVNLLVRMWVDDAGTDPKYRYLLTEKCKQALDEAGIEIPFPQRVVHSK